MGVKYETRLLQFPDLNEVSALTLRKKQPQKKKKNTRGRVKTGNGGVDAGEERRDGGERDGGLVAGNSLE